MPRVLNNAAELAVKVGELIQDDVLCWELTEQKRFGDGRAVAHMHVTDAAGRQFVLHVVEVRQKRNNAGAIL